MQEHRHVAEMTRIPMYGPIYAEGSSCDSLDYECAAMRRPNEQMKRHGVGSNPAKVFRFWLLLLTNCLRVRLGTHLMQSWNQCLRLSGTNAQRPKVQEHRHVTEMTRIPM